MRRHFDSWLIELRRNKNREAMKEFSMTLQSLIYEPPAITLSSPASDNRQLTTSSDTQNFF
jgi:hypothetical protein